MIANALFMTVALLLTLGFWLMGELKFFIPYKLVLWREYATPILTYVALLSVNVFAAGFVFIRKFLPAQPVDATPSKALIRQCFRGRSDQSGCPRSKPSQGSVPADLTVASDLAFVFNASWVRPECCVDPLRPPFLKDTGRKLSHFDKQLYTGATEVSAPWFEEETD